MPGGADKQLVPAWGEIMTLLVTNMTRTQFTDITDVNMNCLWDGHLHLVIIYDTFSAFFLFASLLWSCAKEYGAYRQQ